MTFPKFGDSIGSLNATVIHYSHIEDARPGLKPNGVVLCHFSHAVGEYAVWGTAQNNRGSWDLFSGEYCQTFFEAVQAYEQRRPSYAR